MDRDQLERGFLRLEPELRAVIVLHHYLDLPMPVVATLGIPLGTAKSRLHRALGQMRAALDADARVRGPISWRAVRHDDERAIRRGLTAWLHDGRGLPRAGSPR